MTEVVEGLDNMILFALVFVAFTIALILYIGWKYFAVPVLWRVQTGIHPDYQQVVDFTRAQLQATTNNPNSEAGPGRDGQAETCPVCMEDISYAIETNCGHNFCGRCIITYWHAGHWTGPVNCPMCRATVNLIFPHFTSEEQRESRATEDNDGRRLLTEIAVYNRRYSGAPVPLWEQLRDLPVILPHLISRLFSMDGLDYMYRARILIILFLGALYMLSPVDLLPEVVFGLLGVLDDILVVLMVSIYAVSVYRQYLAQR